MSWPPFNIYDGRELGNRQMQFYKPTRENNNSFKVHLRVGNLLLTVISSLSYACFLLDAFPRLDCIRMDLHLTLRLAFLGNVADKNFFPYSNHFF